MVAHGEAVVGIVPGDDEDTAPALGLGSLQDLVNAAEETKHHCIVGLLRDHFCNGAAPGDHIGKAQPLAVLCQHRRCGGMPLHAGDLSCMRRQRQGKITQATAGVTYVHLLIYIRRKPLHQFPIIGAVLRCVPHEAHHILSPDLQHLNYLQNAHFSYHIPRDEKSKLAYQHFCDIISGNQTAR